MGQTYFLFQLFTARIAPAPCVISLYWNVIFDVALRHGREGEGFQDHRELQHTVFHYNANHAAYCSVAPRCPQHNGALATTQNTLATFLFLLVFGVTVLMDLAVAGNEWSGTHHDPLLLKCAAPTL